MSFKISNENREKRNNENRMSAEDVIHEIVGWANTEKFRTILTNAFFYYINSDRFKEYDQEHAQSELFYMEIILELMARIQYYQNQPYVDSELYPNNIWTSSSEGKNYH